MLSKEFYTHRIQVFCSDLFTDLFSKGYFFTLQNKLQCLWVHITKNISTPWFLRVFQFVINFTPLDILLGIPNYDNSNVIMNLNFVILFAKYFIYDCKKNDKPVDFYHFQVKLKTRMVIEEYRSELYNRKLEFLVKWSVLSDSL